MYFKEGYFSSCHERGTKKKILSPQEESNPSLTLESLWLVVRASEHGIRRSGVRFLMGTQVFFLCPTLVTRRKITFFENLKVKQDR